MRKGYNVWVFLIVCYKEGFMLPPVSETAWGLDCSVIYMKHSFASVFQLLISKIPKTS